MTLFIKQSKGAGKYDGKGKYEHLQSCKSPHLQPPLIYA